VAKNLVKREGKDEASYAIKELGGVERYNFIHLTSA
jgi:hypothetical protein